MAAGYLVAVDGRQRGPVSLDELRRDGVPADAMVWRPGMSQWLRADQVPELQDCLLEPASAISSSAVAHPRTAPAAPAARAGSSPLPVRPAQSFSVRLEADDERPGKRLKWSATLVIDADAATLSIRRPISLLPYPLFARTLTRRIPLGEISSIEVEDTLVRFQRDGTPLDAGPIVLRASAADAARIAALLPDRLSPRYIEQIRQHLNFASSLQEATATAFITPAIIGLNVIIFIAMGLTGAGWFAPTPKSLLPWGADFWPLTTSGQWWRLLTSTFLHYGLLHLAFNMWALFGAGRLTERLYGNVFFAAVYLFSGLTGSLASNAWNHTAVSVGASGAIFGVYGALLAYLLCQRDSFPATAAQTLLKSSLTFVAYNVLFGLSNPFINNAAHLGGLAGGFLMGLAAARPLQSKHRARQTLPRILATTATGAAVLLSGIAGLPRCDYDVRAEQAFESAADEFIEAEAKTIPAANELIERANQAEDQEGPGLAEQLEKCITPWNEAGEKLGSITLTGKSPSLPLQTTLLKYCRTRRAAFQLLVEDWRSGESHTSRFRSLMIEADQAMTEAEHALERRPH